MDSWICQTLTASPAEPGVSLRTSSHGSGLRTCHHEHSRWVGRKAPSERERVGDTEFNLWDGCALACGSIAM